MEAPTEGPFPIVQVYTNGTVALQRKNNVIKRINQLSAAIREKQGKIIFIQHADPSGEYMAEGTPPWAILPELIREKEDLVLRKTANSAFYHTDLEQILLAMKPEFLLITGCATDFCVDATVRAAVNRDFKVTVIKDAHTTTDRPHLNAKTIIKHHNFIWENLLNPDQKVRVAESEIVLKTIQNP